MARKRPPAGPGYNWLDTYADMVTLLLCFFVLLFSMSKIDAQKYSEIVTSFSGAVMPITQPIDPGPVDMAYVVQPAPPSATPDLTPKPAAVDATPFVYPASSRLLDGQFTQLYGELMSYVAGDEMDARVGVGMSGNMITVTFTENVLFDSGRADIRPESTRIIDGMIPFFEEYQDIIDTIRVVGHTDNIPITGSSLYRNNRWLSYFRAGNVVEYIQENSAVSPEKLTADGRGEYQPVDTNDTPEGRARNRRVEFVIVERLAEDVRMNPATFQGAPTPGPSSRPVSGAGP